MRLALFEPDIPQNAGAIMRLCACLGVPGDKGADFIIETHMQTPPPGLPQKMICRFDLVRGPVSVEAEFRNGSVKYELMSFEPGLPFGEDGVDGTDENQED